MQGTVSLSKVTMLTWKSPLPIEQILQRLVKRAGLLTLSE